VLGSSWDQTAARSKRSTAILYSARVAPDPFLAAWLLGQFLALAQLDQCPVLSSCSALPSDQTFASQDETGTELITEEAVDRYSSAIDHEIAFA